ncbi:DUF1735 domain-containing protein [uncultured Alistipes sp.]|uniref:BT_3987 domain-containing protein n=1 Tax=uncultured Alistipes sp. TaxID=538949 RepID=UPI00260FC3ED|nr:DUF1735 domain-containing protein [uncultured Alistipes sp.]
MKGNIMKHTGFIRLFRGAAFGCAATLLLAGCTEEPISYGAGQEPDGEALETVSGTLRSCKSLRDRIPVRLVEGYEDDVADQIYYRLNTTTSQPVTVTVSPDLSLVGTYNDANQTNLQPLPAENVSIGNGGALTVAAGSTVSDPLEVTFSADGLAPGTYLLPLVLQTDSDAAEVQALYYGITVREFDENLLQQGDKYFEIPLDTEWLTVFYENTSDVQAHYADYVAWEKLDAMTFESVYQASLGNIIVLRIAQVDYDTASQRVIFAPTSDLFYTLEHANKYIAPMKDKGRKICVCIEGAGKGIGFCNMTDTQIADFVAQVKSFIETYDLDGINLWDRGTGYGKEGMPPMNTSSYPKLIKAMREALGKDRLLTVVDYEEPTEYFWDTEATGGIAVGDYIDYAWHGYVSEDEPVAFINPYNANTSYTQNYTRKPFAGLDESKYGNVHFPFYGEQNEYYIDVNMTWIMNAILWNIEKTSKLMVFSDLTLPQANFAEQGCINMIANLFNYLSIIDEEFNMPYMYNVAERIPGIYHSSGYDTFAKDW